MQGKITNIIPMIGGTVTVTFELAVPPSKVEGYIGEELDVRLAKWSGPRTFEQNKKMWACIEEIAAAITADKWDVYKMMLRRYGTGGIPLSIPSEAVADFEKLYRTMDVIGDRLVVDDDGTEHWVTDVLAYKGSSQMTTKQMSVLIDGIQSEILEMGLKIPEVDDGR